ncbi:FkbM family methyltransferase [Maribellus mangrovi]|uniref:FkbM family methyltransferase n=1 Tax=Maribellus mangrovi TaxID=3133146 RepID=UPI0030EC7DB0
MKFVKKVGVQMEKYFNADLKRRIKILNTYQIDTLFDIGANVGRYALIMRKAGYSGKIISFEPMSAAFEQLKNNSKNDKNWIINHYGLGNENTETEINISNNSYSSSILNIMPTHVESAPNSRYVAKEEIQLKTFDSVFKSFYKKESRIMMKIDTQGFEKHVLEGAENSLKDVEVLQLEMSLVPLYENEMLYLDMIHYLSSKGFHLYSLESGFSNPNTGQLLQADGIFVRNIL